MIVHGRFADLRLNAGDISTDEAFWPSFTDIMSVIVMVFLIAMVTLLLRNLDLVNELRATMEAERHAAELARSTSAENQSISQRLADSENALSMARLQMLRLEEQVAKQASELALNEDAIAELRHARSLLTRDLENSRSEVRGLQTELAENLDTLAREQRTIAELEAARERDARTSAELQDRVQALLATNEAQANELESALEELQASDQQLIASRDEYSELKIKYDKLFRPARTAQGKYVVEVRYRTRNGRKTIEFKEPGDDAFSVISRKQMTASLDALKAEHGKTLYVKVIIPEKSGLSYNDAWTFTMEVLQNYDYYYQDAASP